MQVLVMPSNSAKDYFPGFLPVLALFTFLILAKMKGQKKDIF